MVLIGQQQWKIEYSGWILEVMNLVNKVINTGAVLLFPLSKMLQFACSSQLLRIHGATICPASGASFPSNGLFSSAYTLIGTRRSLQTSAFWVTSEILDVRSIKERPWRVKKGCCSSDWQLEARGWPEGGWKKQTAGAWPASAFSLLPNCFCPVIRPFD